jgi:hypothetical protein
VAILTHKLAAPSHPAAAAAAVGTAVQMRAEEVDECIVLVCCSQKPVH